MNMPKALIAAALALAALPAYAGKPSPQLLTPTDHTLILIDRQPQMAFSTRSIDVAELRNNVTGLAKSAKAFKVPTILTTVAAKSFSGPIFPEAQAVFPDQKPIDRSTMNTWEDDRVTTAVKGFGKSVSRATRALEPLSRMPAKAKTPCRRAASARDGPLMNLKPPFST